MNACLFVKRSTGLVRNDDKAFVGLPEADKGLPLYAVGAMTRGQMIDASIAYGLIRSTAAVADDLFSELRHPIA